MRWKLRFENYQKALAVLSKAVTLAKIKTLSDLEEEGLIQRFEYTHELAWKVMKDFLEEQGTVSIIGSKGATRESFQTNLITEAEIWMDMIDARNLTSHTYHSQVALDIGKKITIEYFYKFLEFEQKMRSFLNEGEQ